MTARPSPRLRRIGWLSPNATGVAKDNSRPFFERMGELGYLEGRDFAIEWRIADTKNELLPGMAAELAGVPVDVIVAESLPAQLAARDATKTIPIVFVLSIDPVGDGFIASLAQPGGNITGVMAGAISAAEKRVEILKEMVPGLARLAVIGNGNQPTTFKPFVAATVRAAHALRIESTTFAVLNLAELDKTLDQIARDRFDALVLLPAPSIYLDHPDRVPDFANRIGMPQAYADEAVVRAGGLMSFNSNRATQYRRIGDFVDKIFNGALPAGLPFEDATQFDLIINLTASQKLGLTIPQTVLAGATEVIR
jgi:putative ABC transport system substrate-binding protein